jgi:hypothetical protein
MFKSETAFVLGAGASWHYGYPTGEKLVSDVITEASELSEYYARWGRHGQFLTAHARAKVSAAGSGAPAALSNYAKSECDELVEKLKTLNPPVIDYFLGQNPKLQDIGRFAISLVILKAEAAYGATRANKNRIEDKNSSPYLDERERHVDASKFKDDWCRFVIYHLASSCRSMADVLQNNIQFITFNYDTSLERRIYAGLNAIEVFQDLSAKDFLDSNRVTHMYGSVGSYLDDLIVVTTPPPANADIGTIEMFRKMVDAAYLRSKQIRTIDPDEKEKNAEVIKRARSIISGAKHIYVLGYGFDENNNRRLGLAERLGARAHPAQIYFTNFRDNGRVNKQASIAFLNVPNGFQRGTLAFRNCEKSDRDVYSALESDFEFFS